MGATLSGSANPHLAVGEKRRSSLEGTKTAAVKIAKDMKKLTTAAAKLKLKSKPLKIVKTVSADNILVDETIVKERPLPVVSSKPEPIPAPALRRETSRPECRLSDVTIALGHYVQQQCPSHVYRATEVVQWIRTADRNLQLNGWTLSSFICESHIVFTFTLVREALAMFECKTAVDVKQLFFLCLYISYTYNANEISYPLKPFLIQKDRAAFWDRCLMLSMTMTHQMMQLNQDHMYYSATLKELKSFVRPAC